MNGKRILIIPAAGLGTRLPSKGVPKVLFPVNGTPMLRYLFDLYTPYVDRIVLVLNPAFENDVRHYCAEKYPSLCIDYAIQESPEGMLDAILVPRDTIDRSGADWIWITWCDQIAVRPETVRRLSEISNEACPHALIMPTVCKTDPYIHLQRNQENRIVDVLQKREGDSLPDPGENDVGLFCLSRHCYLNLLRLYSTTAGTGKASREKNFLPFVAWLALAAPEVSVYSFSASYEIESVGINTQDDLRRVEHELRRS